MKIELIHEPVAVDGPLFVEVDEPALIQLEKQGFEPNIPLAPFPTLVVRWDGECWRVHSTTKHAVVLD